MSDRYVLELLEQGRRSGRDQYAQIIKHMAKTGQSEAHKALNDYMARLTYLASMDTEGVAVKGMN